MKRFVKTFATLMGVLLLLITGVNTALDRVAASPAQGSFVYYSGKGRPLYVYNGNPALCKFLNRPLVPHVVTTPRA
jgi:hypothetical protein